MSNEQSTVTYSVAEVLTRLEQKIDRLQQDTGDIKAGLAALSEKVEGMDNRLRVVEGTQKNQIWTLIILLAGTIATASVKIFGIVGNP